MVGHAEDGFCTKPSAHGTSGRGGASVRPGRHGRRQRALREPPATPGAARQRRRPVCRGWSCSCVLEKQQVVVLRHATAKPREVANPCMARRTARPARKLPWPSWQRRKKWGPPPTPSTAEADTTTTAARAARAAEGDGGQHGESTGSRSYTNTRRAGRQAPGPATPATGLHTPLKKEKTQKESVETRCRRCQGPPPV